jgi:tetratricopeptide (TPR) repeat protein
VTAYREAESAADDLTKGRYDEALARAEHAISLDPTNPWARYDQAVALRHLGRIDAAITSFREAESRFGDGEPHGKAIAIYGRARALDDFGRCAEATKAYGEFAAFVEILEPASAERAREYAKACRPLDLGSPAFDMAMTRLSSAVITGRYAEALSLADPIGDQAWQSGWFQYDKAVALAHLARTDEAVIGFRTAQERFASTDPHAMAIAIYGRARALDNAGRCTEAKRAYDEYARLVRSTSPSDAEMATSIANACNGR